MGRLNLFIAVIAFLCVVTGCEMPQPVVKETAPAISAPIEIPSPAKLPDSVCIAAVGDIMLGTSYPNNSTLPQDSALNSFKYVEQHLQNADVTFGNLEGTLLDGGEPAHYKLHLRSKGYLFRMPAKYCGILKNAGFDVLSMANNHSGDFGETGRNSTIKALDSCGIHYAGLLEYPSVEFERNGIKYGFCAFAPNSHTLSIFDMKGAAQLISGLKQRCDIVIVSFHGGAEGPEFEHVMPAGESYFSERRGDLRAFAHNAIDNGADLILGHGPHVSRAMEIYKDRLIAYSLGNFCTYRGVSIDGIAGIAPLLKVNVNRNGEFLSGNIISVKQSRDRHVEPDTLHRAAKRVKWLSTADFPDNKQLAISATGVLSVTK
ncbi:CapA family protein [Mucilaginibacter calamicampi]|uniref:CapA family protein n=1 Tax=Mucilaginibacter calamicampi TaxID=1302352 RepID=A0ABW2Z5F5_9SPHI